MQHITIIGSGIAGLSAAVYLAGKGFSVRVMEKSPHVAPTLAGFTRKGVYFDTGMHLSAGLRDGEILHSYLKVLGVEAAVPRIRLCPEESERIVFSDGAPAISLPDGRAGRLEALSAYFPGERAAIEAYMQATAQVVSSSPYLNPGVFSPDALESIPPDTTLAQTLAGLTGNSDLCLALSIHCALHGALPHQARFHSHALVDGGMSDSLGTFAGGGKTLVNALVEECLRRGVSIHTGTAVTRICTDGGRVSAVLADTGERIPCTHCLYTGHPALLSALVHPGDSFRPVYHHRLASLPETLSCYIYYGLVDAPVIPGSPGTPGQGDHPLSARALYLCPGREPGRLFDGTDIAGNIIFMTVSPRQQGKNTQALVAVAPCRYERFAPWAGTRRGARPQAYLEAKEAVAAGMEKRILSAFPELAGHLARVEASTPLSLADYTGNPRAGIYGVLHGADHVSLLPRTRVEGLILAGQSILLPGVLGSMVSALVACGFLYDKQRIHEELRQWHDSVLS